MAGYENLRIYQKAMGGVVLIYKITTGIQKTDYSLTHQMRTSSILIPAFIAKGYGKTKKETKKSIKEALGSLNMLSTYLNILSILYTIDIEETKDYYTVLGKQIYKYKKSLDNK